MEVLKIVALCLSCFSLGVSLTGLLFMTLTRPGEGGHQPTRRTTTKPPHTGSSVQKPKEPRHCDNCKHASKSYKEKPCWDCMGIKHWEPKEEKGEKDG